MSDENGSTRLVERKGELMRQYDKLYGRLASRCGVVLREDEKTINNISLEIAAIDCQLENIVRVSQKVFELRSYIQLAFSFWPKGEIDENEIPF